MAPRGTGSAAPGEHSQQSCGRRDLMAVAAAASRSCAAERAPRDVEVQESRAVLAPACAVRWGLRNEAGPLATLIQQKRQRRWCAAQSGGLFPRHLDLAEDDIS